MVSAEQNESEVNNTLLEKIKECNEMSEELLNKLNVINDKLSEIDERIAIMSEPHFHSQDDLIFPPLDDELKTEGD